MTIIRLKTNNRKLIYIFENEINRVNFWNVKFTSLNDLIEHLFWIAIYFSPWETVLEKEDNYINTHPKSKNIKYSIFLNVKTF